MVLEFLDRLELDDVTLVGNDHAAVLAAAVQGSPRLGRLVVTSCEAFENFPPGLPGKNLRLTALLPGGLLGIAQLLRVRGLRRQPLTFGWLSKRPLPDALVDEWLRPFQTEAGVRRDLRRYAAGARRRQMDDICARLADVTLPTLVIWTDEDRIQRRDHGARLAQIIPNACLELVSDSYTLVMRDQPQQVSALVRRFANRDHSRAVDGPSSPPRARDHAAAVADGRGGSR
jgi:pimeloyl-ACP methyl ester carboxylesterase